MQFSLTRATINTTINNYINISFGKNKEFSYKN